MSLTLALSSSLSGLKLAARGTQVVADNIANAQTGAYGVRSLTQAARMTGSTGSGVAMTGIRRDVDQALLGELRTARSRDLGEDIRLAFWNSTETAIGLPGQPGSLTGLVDRLEAALQKASADPASPAHLAQVVQSAGEISQHFRMVNQSLVLARDQADAAIAKSAIRLNDALESVASLNDRIQRQTLLGGAPESLKDERQRVVDQISDMVSIRQFDREDDRIMLMGADGTILVDRKAAVVSFERSYMPDANEKVEDGTLGLMRINGQAISPESVLFATGQIGANFYVRDVAAPEVQAQLDALAADLTARFMVPDVDQSLAPDEFGLFALQGHGAPASALAGISGRLILNPQLEGPGDTTWRLRNGLGMAATPSGPVSDNTLLDRMLSALTAAQPLATGAQRARSISGHSSDLLSMTATQRLGVEENKTIAAAQHAALNEAFAAKGVDTDKELSNLLVLEQAYAANARVISTIDAMLRKLLEL